MKKSNIKKLYIGILLGAGLFLSSPVESNAMVVVTPSTVEVTSDKEDLKDDGKWKKVLVEALDNMDETSDLLVTFYTKNEVKQDVREYIVDVKGLVNDSLVHQYYKTQFFTVSSHFDEKLGIYKTLVKFDRYENEDEAKWTIEELNRIEKYIVENYKLDTDYDVLYAVNDYIVKRVTYTFDLDNGNPHSLYDFLQENKGVCQAYAMLGYHLLDNFGIESKYLMGKVHGGELHAWVGVNIGGYWYHSDPTWNDPVGYDHITNRDDSQGEYYRTKYLLLTDSEINQSREVYTPFVSTNVKYNSSIYNDFNYKDMSFNKNFEKINFNISQLEDYVFKLKGSGLNNTTKTYDIKISKEGTVTLKIGDKSKDIGLLKDTNVLSKYTYVEKSDYVVDYKNENGDIYITLNNINNDGKIEENIYLSEKLNFKDIENVYSKYDILELYEKGIVKGTTSDTYSPWNNITRGQFSVMVARALNITSNNNVFNDVKGHPYQKEINALYEAGIVKGKTATTFNPNDKLTREQAILMLDRMMDYKGFEYGESMEIKTKFKDFNKVSDYAKGSVTKLVNLGIVSGTPDGYLKSKDNLNRAQMAVLLNKVLKITE